MAAAGAGALAAAAAAAVAAAAAAVVAAAPGTKAGIPAGVETSRGGNLKEEGRGALRKQRQR